MTGTPILGLFNISARNLTDIIPLSRFFGVLSSLQYVVRAHTTGFISDPWTPDSASSRLVVSLEPRGYEIFTAFPLSTFHSDSRGQVVLANLGLLEKMSGCAAILNSSFELLTNGRMFVDTRLKALGVLGNLITVVFSHSSP